MHTRLGPPSWKLSEKKFKNHKPNSEKIIRYTLTNIMVLDMAIDSYRGHSVRSLHWPLSGQLVANEHGNKTTTSHSLIYIFFLFSLLFSFSSPVCASPYHHIISSRHISFHIMSHPIFSKSGVFYTLTVSAFFVTWALLQLFLCVRAGLFMHTAIFGWYGWLATLFLFS